MRKYFKNFDFVSGTMRMPWYWNILLFLHTQLIYSVVSTATWKPIPLNPIWRTILNTVFQVRVYKPFPHLFWIRLISDRTRITRSDFNHVHLPETCLKCLPSIKSHSRLNGKCWIVYEPFACKHFSTPVQNNDSQHFLRIEQLGTSEHKSICRLVMLYSVIHRFVVSREV